MIEKQETIYSWTLIDRDAAPTGFVGLAPYIELLVKLDTGEMVTGRMTDVAREVKEGTTITPEIGDRVELVIRKLHDNDDSQGLITYGPTFRHLTPVLSKEELKAKSDELWEFWDPKLIKRSLSE